MALKFFLGSENFVKFVKAKKLGEDGGEDGVFSGNFRWRVLNDDGSVVGESEIEAVVPVEVVIRDRVSGEVIHYDIPASGKGDKVII